MINRFFTKKVNTKRLERKGGYDDDKDTETWEDYLENVYCHIQTWLGGEVGYEGSKFPTHQLWCNLGVDIIDGHRIIDGSNVYEVLKVELLNMGKNPHMSVLISLIKGEAEGS